MAECQKHRFTRPMVCIPEPQKIHSQLRKHTGGFTYCALSILSFLDRLPDSPSNGESSSALTDLDLTIRWLVSRQTATLDEDDLMDTYGDETDTAIISHDVDSFLNLNDNIQQSQINQDPTSSEPTSSTELQWVGFNGRCNKIADTCYSWWVGASLVVRIPSLFTLRYRSDSTTFRC
jgi:geranylgeranyl transferase type-1 subunit beta